jgi:hypothetical protein
MGYIDKTPDKATKVSLIKTLQTVTEGKVRRAGISGLESGDGWWWPGMLRMLCCRCSADIVAV